MTAKNLDEDLLSLLQENRGSVVSYRRLLNQLFRIELLPSQIRQSQEYKQINESLRRHRERLHPLEFIGYVNKGNQHGLRLLNKQR